MNDSSSGLQDKGAMSKALGQAFLAHQVRQLEAEGIRSQREPARRRHLGTNVGNQTEQSIENRQAASRSRAHQNESASLGRNKGMPSTIVIDASALIFALDQIKTWCSTGAKPSKIIIPLEVLNTLDLFKKGTSFVSVQARAASRLLEEQVGTNQRIVLQEDGAASVWHDASTTSYAIPPLWLRNLLTCAIWERDHSTESVALAFVETARTFDGEESKGIERIQGKSVYEWSKRLGITPLSLTESRLPEKQVYSGKRTPHAQLGYSEGRSRRPRNARASLPNEPLVEKQPPSQLATTGVRLLARGEKLEP